METNKKVVITGGCGFIGSHFIDLLLERHPNYKIHNIDKCTYAALNKQYIESLSIINYWSGIEDSNIEEIIKDADWIVNFAAESHVCNSIKDPPLFVDTNIKGLNNLLLAATKTAPNTLLCQVSSDEVYGSIPYPKETFEDTLLNPWNVYSASKASGDMLVLAYRNTFKLKTLITRSSNNYGPRQHFEKLIPQTIKCMLNEDAVPIHSDGTQIRDWLYVRDNCEAILMLLELYDLGLSPTYPLVNISSRQDREITNNELVQLISAVLDKNFKVKYYPDARPGIDQRYCMNSDKLRNLGWKPKTRLMEGLMKTANWYKQHIKVKE